MSTALDSEITTSGVVSSSDAERSMEYSREYPLLRLQASPGLVYLTKEWLTA